MFHIIWSPCLILWSRLDSSPVSPLAAQPFSWVLTLSASKATTQLCTLWHPGGKSGVTGGAPARHWGYPFIAGWFLLGKIPIEQMDENGGHAGSNMIPSEMGSFHHQTHGDELNCSEKHGDLSSCANGDVSVKSRPSPGRWKSADHIELCRKIGNPQTQWLIIFPTFCCNDLP